MLRGRAKFVAVMAAVAVACSSGPTPEVLAACSPLRGYTSASNPLERINEFVAATDSLASGELVSLATELQEQVAQLAQLAQNVVDAQERLDQSPRPANLEVLYDPGPEREAYLERHEQAVAEWEASRSPMRDAVTAARERTAAQSEALATTLQSAIDACREMGVEITP